MSVSPQQKAESKNAATALCDFFPGWLRPAGRARSQSLLLPSQFWPILFFLRGVISGEKLCHSHSFSPNKWIDEWSVDPHPVLTLTTSAKVEKTA